MEFRQVEYVLAIIDQGSFTAAARACAVAQPSLSESVRRLEDELGVRLFHRVGRGVVLTDSGVAFEGPARRMVRERQLAFDAVGAVRALDRGSFDIVALPTLAVDPLAPLIGQFRVAHPGVAVRIAQPEDARAVEEHVADGRSELGLEELPARHDELVEIQLARQEIVAVCPPGTKLRTPGRLAISQLASLPLVATPSGTSMRDILDRALASEQVDATIAVETAQREAIAPLVLGGAGVSFLPRSMAAALESDGVVVARFVPALTRTIGFVHRATPLTPAARAFVEIARSSARGRRSASDRG